MRYIWRLEYEDGEGFYTRSNRRDFNGDGERWPVPWVDRHRQLKLTLAELADRSGRWQVDFIFGFRSIRQAKAWFDCCATLKHYDAKGLKLVAYRRSECRSVWSSDHQTIFIGPGIGGPYRDLTRRAIFKASELWTCKNLTALADQQFALLGD